MDEGGGDVAKRVEGGDEENPIFYGVGGGKRTGKG